MTAIFSEPIAGREFEGPDGRELTGWFIDDLASDAGHWPDWVVEAGAGLPVRLTLLAHESGRSVRIGFAAGGVEGVIEAAPDPSGWVLVTAGTGGAELFRAYLHRPYEEYELWPAGAEPAPQDEAPGRMSRKRWWVSLSTAAWPALSPPAPQGWLTAMTREAWIDDRLVELERSC